jgi:hypothetical protein
MTQLDPLRASQGAQAKVPEVLVGGGDDRERIARSALGETDVAGLRKRPREQALNPRNSRLREGKRSLGTLAANSATGAG